MQDDKLLIHVKAVKKAVIAWAEFPQPAFDPAGVQHAQVRAELFQQAGSDLALALSLGERLSMNSSTGLWPR